MVHSVVDKYLQKVYELMLSRRDELFSRFDTITSKVDDITDRLDTVENQISHTNEICEMNAKNIATIESRINNEDLSGSNDDYGDVIYREQDCGCSVESLTNDNTGNNDETFYDNISNNERLTYLIPDSDHNSCECNCVQERRRKKMETSIHRRCAILQNGTELTWSKAKDKLTNYIIELNNYLREISESSVANDLICRDTGVYGGELPGTRGDADDRMLLIPRSNLQTELLGKDHDRDVKGKIRRNWRIYDKEKLTLVLRQQGDNNIIM